MIDPGRELLDVVSALVALIGEDHQPIVILGSQDSAHALRGLTHGIEGEEVCIADLVVFLEEEHAGAQVSRGGVLEWDSKHHDTPSIVACKIDSFRHFTASNGEKHSTSAIVTSLLVVLKSHDCLFVVFGLDEDQFVLEDALENAHLVPLDNHMLHVPVRREEANHAVGHDSTELFQEVAIVPNHSSVLSLLELRAHMNLVKTLGHYQWLNRVSRQMDLECPCHSWLKVKHLRVNLHR